MNLLAEVVNADAPSRAPCKARAMPERPKKAAQETRGLKVSNREASNRVTEVTRSNPVKDYGVKEYR